MRPRFSDALYIVLVAMAIPLLFSALSPVESWVTTYLFQRGEVSYYGYGAIRIAEMALFALATTFLAYQVFSPKRWTILSLGIGLVISAALLVNCETAPLFDDFDMLRAYLATAYGVAFLLALSGKVSA